MSPPNHLYIHIPFCSSRCDYCDFYSETDQWSLMDSYIDALLCELESETDNNSHFETIYLGGGTPTLLGAARIERLMTALRNKADISGQIEVTIEANPATINVFLADGMVAAGINRISVGVQSFLPAMRRRLGRRGDPAQISKTVRLLRDAGFINLGIDMIFGIPGQTEADLSQDLKRLLELGPDHVSYYGLTIKSGSDYHARFEDEMAAMEEAGLGRRYYERVVDTLEGAGFEWYETSNFARPGFTCRHNIAYWNNADYLGIGAGAWSTKDNARWRNVEDITNYIDGKPESGRVSEELSTKVKTREKVIMGLRCQTGVIFKEIESEIDQSRLMPLCEAGLLKKSSGNILLTREGRFVGNEVTAQLLK